MRERTARVRLESAVTAMDLLGAIPAGLVPVSGLFTAVLLLGIGVPVLGEIRDGMRGAR